jgi:hypothetical protein
MDWDQFRAARAVLSEQRLGKVIRADAEAEDARFAAAAKALRKMGG